MRLAVLVPVKRFTAAKGRLTGVLDDEQRARLAEWMATRVVQTVAELPTFVACDDPAVAEWAERLGAQVLWSAGLGLNGAVDDGVARVEANGFEHVIVTHADLPRPAALVRVARPGARTFVPDRRQDGTNVMAFPTASPIRAAYGGGSFQRHLTQAMTASDTDIDVRFDPELSLDLDTLRDLTHPLIREVLPSWLPTIPGNPSR